MPQYQPFHVIVRNPDGSLTLRGPGVTYEIGLVADKTDGTLLVFAKETSLVIEPTYRGLELHPKYEYDETYDIDRSKYTETGWSC